MAKITFGGVVTDARNKLGDVVYSRNRGGSFARAYHLHNLSNTTRQAAIRAVFKAVQTRYLTTLTTAQRNAWNIFAAAQTPRPKAISPAHLTGQNWYYTLNMNLQSWAGTFLDDPPNDLAGYDCGGFSSAILDTESQILLVGANMAPSANQLVAVSFTKPLSAARYAFNPFLTGEDVLAFGGQNPTNFWTDYVTDYATPSSTSRIGVQIQGLNLLNGVMQKGYTALLTAGNQGDAMLQATVTLTAAQVKALIATPQQIVPAPGAGFAIIPIRAGYNYKYLTTVYTIPGGYVFNLTYDTSATALVAMGTVTMIDQTHNTDVQAGPSSLLLADSVAQNKALVIKGAGTATELTNGLGTIEFFVQYATVPVQ